MLVLSGVKELYRRLIDYHKDRNFYSLENRIERL